MVFTLLSAGTVVAGTGIYTSFWSGSGFTMSMSTNRYSNAAAWWQNLLNSTGKCLTLDGDFGPTTKNATIAWQSDTGYDTSGAWQAGSTNGVVNSDDYNKMQFARAGSSGTGYFYRHQYAGYTDGFATQYWTYYGGGAEALIGWNPYAAQQFFNPYRISQSSQTTGWTLLAATASRTLTQSYGCAA